jgi:hypothetical protein
LASRPSPEEIELLKAKIVEILGDEFTMEEVGESDEHLALAVGRVDGQPFDAEEVSEKLKELGQNVPGMGFVIPVGPSVPDTLTDDILGALDPNSLTDKYGASAPAFVEQLGHLLVREWQETTDTMQIYIDSCKKHNVPVEIAADLAGDLTLLLIDMIRSRQFLGALLERYRAEHILSDDDMDVLLKTATQRIGDSSLSKQNWQFVEEIRKSYLGEEEFRYSTPPLTFRLFSQLWKATPKDS